MPVSIIPTKIIIPKRQPSVIRRPRLIDFLHENLARKLILITAPAGYGKTTLLVDFASDVDLAVCWLTLDENDRDPSTFLAHLVAAIQQKFPQFGTRSMPLAEYGAPSAHAVATALVADMVADVPDYFVLVLDDWHLVSEEATIGELVDQLLRYLPEHAHLVVAGRTLLRGPLVRLAAQGAVAGLGSADLRFTAEEVREVLAAKYSLNVSAEQAWRLTEEAEGWITAILLSSQSTWHAFLAGLAHAHDSSGTLFEYLAGEVFAHLPGELQRFLFESAVLRQFTEALCDELRRMPGTREWVDQVEARNLFLTRVEAAGDVWYRYHHLFRDFLLARFKRDDQRTYVQLQLRAGELFEVSHQLEEAVEHFLAAGAPERAAQVMNIGARNLYITGRTQTLLRWARLLRVEQRPAAPYLVLYQSQVLSDHGEPLEALAALQEAEATFVAQHDVIGQVRVILARGWSYCVAGRFKDALATGQMELQHMRESQINDPEWQAQALRLVGRSYNGLGQWQEAEQYLTGALALYRSSPSHEQRAYNLGRTLQDLAYALRAMGRLEEAAMLQAESLALWREIGNPASLAHCLNNIGYDRYVIGDYDGALKWYAEALIQAEAAEDLRVNAMVLDGIAAAYRDRGDFERATEVYAQVFNLTGSIGDQLLISWALDGLGHAHRLAGDLDRALALFEQARSIATREGIDVQVRLSTASIGITRVEQGNVEAGSSDLLRSAAALRESDAHLDLARVLLWLARAYYLGHQETLANDRLAEMVRLGHRLGCRPFSLAEGRRALPFLKWGVEHLPADQRLNGWLRDIQESIAPPIEISPALPAPPRIEVRALGAGRVWRDGHMLTATDWGRSANARELLFYLLEHPSSRKEEIGAQFWPELSAARMTSSFHAAKYRARRALGTEFVIYDYDSYGIDPNVSIWYDVAEFRRLVKAGRQARTDVERIDTLRQAVTLYTGDYLSDVYTEWAAHTRDQLHLRFFEALNLLVDSLLRQRQFDEALGSARSGLEIDYFREDLHRAVILCLAETGRITEALAHYEAAAKRLMKELNTAPAPETTALVERIRLGQFAGAGSG